MHAYAPSADVRQRTVGTPSCTQGSIFITRIFGVHRANTSSSLRDVHSSLEDSFLQTTQCWPTGALHALQYAITQGNMQIVRFSSCGAFHSCGECALRSRLERLMHRANATAADCRPRGYSADAATFFTAGPSSKTDSHWFVK
jgi:hypothetical protein